MKFHIHSASASKKGNQILGIIKKSYNTRDALTFSTLYKSMVRIHLVYGNTIWGPYYQGDSKAEESVERRATKLITVLKDKSYEERIRELKLPSLVYRRRRGDIIQMFKIMNGLVRMDKEKLFSPTKTLHTRGHPQRIFKEHAEKLIRSRSFSQRVVNDWNNLPVDLVEATSLNIFKNRLDELWRHIWYETSH